MAHNLSVRASRTESEAGRRDKDRAARPGIHTPESWLWIPGSRVSRAPRNDRKGTFACLVGVVLFASFVLASPAFAADPSPEDVDQGRQVYDDNCATCHGRDMVTSGVAAPDLRKFPKDGEASFRTMVLDGKGGMSAWRDKLSDDDLKLLWAYLRSGG
jgi:cytochrome c6